MRYGMVEALLKRMRYLEAYDTKAIKTMQGESREESQTTGDMK